MNEGNENIKELSSMHVGFWCVGLGFIFLKALFLKAEMKMKRDTVEKDLIRGSWTG